MRGNDSAFRRRREMVAVGLIVNSERLLVIVLIIRRDVDLYLHRLAGRHVEFPESKILFVDDGLAVTGN